MPVDELVAAEGHGGRADPARPRLWRVTDRASFVELRTRGHRARRAPVTVTWLAPQGPPGPPRVALAVGKAAGGAVARNRIRRRLRAAAAELARRDRLPAGTYLLSAGPEAARTPWPDLVAALDEAIAATPAVSP